jgi:hypothetical protein
VEQDRREYNGIDNIDKTKIWCNLMKTFTKNKHMKLSISVTQITDGTDYEGLIEGLSERINYHLSFGVPIKQLDSQVLPEDSKERMAVAKKLFNFSVTKADQALDVTDEMFVFMVSTAGQLAVSFYNNPQTRQYAESDDLLASAIRDKEKSLLGVLGMKSASIGMSTQINIPENSIPEVLR